MKVTQFQVEVNFELAMVGDTRTDLLATQLQELIAATMEQFKIKHSMIGTNPKVTTMRADEAAP